MDLFWPLHILVSRETEFGCFRIVLVELNTAREVNAELVSLAQDQNALRLHRN